MSGQVAQRVRVHVRCRSRQTGVPEGVEREICDLRQRTGLGMLLLQGGLLDVAAPGRRREHPLAFRRRTPRFQDGHRPLRQRDRAPCVFGLTKRNVDRTVPNVFPPKAEALFRPETAIDQDRRNVPQQVRITRAVRLGPPEVEPFRKMGANALYESLVVGEEPEVEQVLQPEQQRECLRG